MRDEPGVNVKTIIRSSKRANAPINVMSYTQIYYHIVFSTKDRVPVLIKDRRRDLYEHMWGFLKKKNCHLYRIGGVDNHVHLLTSVHAAIALSDLIRDLKTASRAWIKRDGVFESFPGWQNEYGAFTLSHSQRGTVTELHQKPREAS